MAIYHCSCKIISRNSGHSAVAASAYRSGTEMTSEYNGITHNYTPKGNTGQVVHSEVMLCENAPEKYRNRENLWNEVERAEKGSNAQLAREYEFALPRELSHAEQIKFIREFVHENLVKNGMCADWAIHDKGDGNPHVHVMTTMRPIDENGKWENKAEKLYLCKNSKGEEQAFTSKELLKDENAEWKKQYHYSKNGNPKGKKMYLSEYEISKNPKYKNFERIKGDKYPKTEKFGKQNVKIEEWNSKEFLEKVRENLSVAINKELERKELPQRVDHRSYERQGIEKIPTIHEGKSAREREDKRTNPKYEMKYKDRYKEPTEKIEINRKIQKANTELKEVKKEIHDTQRTIHRIQSDMEWSKFHESCATIERYIQQNPDNEKVQKYALEQMAKLESNLNRMVAVEIKTNLHADKFYGTDDRKISYLDFHRDKAMQDMEYLKAHATQNLVEIEMAKEPPVTEYKSLDNKIHVAEKQIKETSPQQHHQEPVHADPKQVSEAKAVSFDVDSVASKLAEYNENYIKAMVQSEGRTSYQENPIYEKQARELSEWSKNYKEVSDTIKTLKDQKAELKPYQFKQKKIMDNKITDVERIRRSIEDKMQVMGTDPSRANEKIKELKSLAQQEKLKVQEAKENIGASGRAVEAEKSFVALAKTIPENKKQAVFEKVKTIITEKRKQSGGFEYRVRISTEKKFATYLQPQKTHTRGKELTKGSKNNRTH